MLMNFAIPSEGQAGMAEQNKNFENKADASSESNRGPNSRIQGTNPTCTQASIHHFNISSGSIHKGE
jgi:hypothetical protein